MNGSRKGSRFPTTSFATPADAAAIERLLAEAFAEVRSLYTPAGFAATTPTAEVIAARMAEGPVWVVFEDDAIIGTLGGVVRPSRPPAGRPEAGTTRSDLYLRSMAVLPRKRGQRIGLRLLEAAELFAGDRDLVLSTTPFLDRAIALYERCGFQRTDEPPHDLFGTPLFTMRKRHQRDHGGTTPFIRA